ncbi:acyl-CoA dehydrogenase family protein [Bradyrhizobium sp. 1]|uniref:acyl-CoA dehydrogenase family protein n=1 Tax=Bradyrhizobium sp. 1 TaxID=241591 RepID=UPI001FFBFA3F|nr:acyl-CoA dehydrogenase family protein [Bradyrhizobium sp. 1]MCK1394515.1 acyl-CoA dehydrogenase family protein [Bradyrhizobium sp. 1]
MAPALSQIQKEAQLSARKFAEDVLKPAAQRVDTEAEFPSDAVRAMADLGFTGLSVPEEYGGLNRDALTICLVTEELARGCPSTAGVLMAFVIGIQPIVRFGTAEQKRTYLPDLAIAKRSICFAVTEAHTGSDVSAISTTAKREGDGWRLSGVKTLIGNAVNADLCILAAKTDAGVSVFIVDARSPGYSVSKVYEKMGMRGTTTGEITLDNVHVPNLGLVGVEGRGASLLLGTLDLARLTLAAEAIGIAQRALEEALSYSLQRSTFGKQISEYQAIQFMIADMATSIHASRVMLHDACQLADGGQSFTREAAMVKLFSSEMANRAADTALQVRGGWGLVDRSTVERLYRDARYTRIWEGTSEIQRLVIFRSLLKTERGG